MERDMIETVTEFLAWIEGTAGHVFHEKDMPRVFSPVLTASRQLYRAHLHETGGVYMTLTAEGKRWLLH